MHNYALSSAHTAEQRTSYKEPMPPMYSTWSCCNPDTSVGLNFLPGLCASEHQGLCVQEALSGVWSRRQLFVATHTALHCIFVAAHPDAPQPFLDVSHVLAPQLL